jgi:predicted transcriptional regulator of viral defense system
MSLAVNLGLVADLAEAQHGFVTTRQAQARSVPRRDLARLAAAGALERAAHGVYRVAGAPRDRLGDLRAAWLQLAPQLGTDERSAADGVVSHSSAAVVYQVGFLDPFWFDFTVPGPRRARTRRPDVRIYHAPIGGHDARWAEDMFVTSPARTVADLAAQRLDGEHLAGVVRDLLAAGHADTQTLASALAPYAQAYGLPDRDGTAFLTILQPLGRTGHQQRPVPLRHLAGFWRRHHEPDQRYGFVLAGCGGKDSGSLIGRAIGPTRPNSYYGLPAAAKVAAPHPGTCWVVTKIVVRYHIGVRHYSATSPYELAVCTHEAAVKAAMVAAEVGS